MSIEKVTNPEFKKKDCMFTGRNGMGKCHGVEIMSISSDCLMISPITSKGAIGRCDITIPVEAIGDVIASLTKVKNDILKTQIVENMKVVSYI